MAQKAPGKSYRKGITLLELAERFPTEEAAVKWFESVVWGDERGCGHCGSVDTYEVKNAKPMPYRCRDCKQYFSVKTGTWRVLRSLFAKWVYAIYLDVTSLKGVASMKLHRDLGVTQKTALVHAAAHPRSVPGGRPCGLRGAGGSGRDLFSAAGKRTSTSPRS